MSALCTSRWSNLRMSLYTPTNKTFNSLFLVSLNFFIFIFGTDDHVSIISKTFSHSFDFQIRFSLGFNIDNFYIHLLTRHDSRSKVEMGQLRKRLRRTLT